MIWVNHLIDLLYFIDIAISFRTTYYHNTTGDEILNAKDIAKNYILSFRFWIDLFSTIPFDLLIEGFVTSEFS